MQSRTLLVATVLLPLLAVIDAGAATRYAGRHYYVATLFSTQKFPIFTKEFIEGEEIVSTGGVRDIWLPDQRRTVGLRAGFDDIGRNRAGLGFSLTYWRYEFDGAVFPYARNGAQTRIAEYRTPTQSLVFLDVNGLYMPWESQRSALAAYCLLGMVADYEKYYIDKFSITEEGTDKIDFQTQKRSNVDSRIGFGIGARFYYSTLASLWVEKRWIKGETFSTDRTVEEGGFFSNDEQKTLYAPISSVGLALFF